MHKRPWIVQDIPGIRATRRATLSHTNSSGARKAEHYNIDDPLVSCQNALRSLQTNSASFSTTPRALASSTPRNHLWCEEIGIHLQSRPGKQKVFRVDCALSGKHSTSIAIWDGRKAETDGVSGRDSYLTRSNLGSSLTARASTRSLGRITATMSLTPFGSRSYYTTADDHTDSRHDVPAQHEGGVEDPPGTAMATDQAVKDQDGAVDEVLEPTTTQIEAVADVPPISSLRYKIPEDVYKEARSKRSEPVPTYWTYSLYLSPEGEHVPCHYVRKKDAAERVAKLFVNETLLGFDLEWKAGGFGFKKNSIKDNVSVMQLASESRVALFHVSLHYGDKIEDLMPPTLKEILSSPDIIKAGVSISADCTRLQKNLGVEVKGQFELSHLHNLVKHAQSNPKLVTRRLVNLAAQTEEHLGLPLAKGDVRQSDWTKELSMEQVVYAASDAYAAVHLFDVLNQKRLAMNPTPPLPAFAEERKPIDLGDLATVEVSSSSDEDLVDFEEDESDELENVAATSETRELPIRTRSQPSPTAVKSSKSTTGSPLTASETPVSEEVSRANAWVADYRSPATFPTAPVTYPSLSPESKPSSNVAQLVESPNIPAPKLSSIPASPSQSRSASLRATPAHLRSYYLWHHETMEVSTISSLLRAPPLQTTTVAGYILNAIQFEKLPYDRSRALEVLSIFPVTVRKGRYGRILEQCERG